MDVNDWFDTMTAVRVGTEDALRDRRDRATLIDVFRRAERTMKQTITLQGDTRP